MIRSLIAIVLSAGFAAAQHPKAAYVLEYHEKPRVYAVLDYTLKCPNITGSEWIVAVPVAPELSGQKKPKTTFSLAHKIVKEKSDEAREVMIAQVPVKTAVEKTAISMEVTYEVTLYARDLRRLKQGETRPKVDALEDTDRKLYLAATPDLNYTDSKYQQWLAAGNLKRGEKETDVDFAKRVFEHIRSFGKYEYGGKMDRRVSAVCETGKTDCGGFSQLFAAALRANGIPARCLFGRWAESAKAGSTAGKIEYFQWHVIAEFYADGIGWVPVDVSGSIIYENPGTASRYFGNQPGTFLTQHVDANLLVDSVHFGVVDLQNIQQPAWWVRGLGKTDDHCQIEGWKVTIKK